MNSFLKSIHTFSHMLKPYQMYFFILNSTLLHILPTKISSSISSIHQKLYIYFYIFTNPQLYIYIYFNPHFLEITLLCWLFSFTTLLILALVDKIFYMSKNKKIIKPFIPHQFTLALFCTNHNDIKKALPFYGENIYFNNVVSLLTKSIQELQKYAAINHFTNFNNR